MAENLTCYHDCLCYDACPYHIDEETEMTVAECDRFKNQADFVEVKRARWLDNIEKGTTVAGVTKEFAVGYKCSRCGRTEISKEPYCNCGAKMEEGNAE